ncbi:flagellar motor switch protein FliG [Xanthobacter flavus]|uniref:Flagellar motor switch protein FliG n=1 Tax=Xanthobacter flavus TaxID=281 RepID=A0A9W6CHX9_XANFL|nr:flagellar motor switch protein FliG [Xanthobacter flavus]MBN8914991.1 flagellar motor switch protein FliG [Hyphomicrobiales bacterium]MDR6333824.1 flagellar motor switch protein FliG [Xanthobacter flavus]GLI20421.1 flagellar motor switch protein FliG [Xanthobacter flavus]
MPAASAAKPRPLQGIDRVAALLMAMGTPAANRVMKHFEPDEIRLITRSIASLKPVSTAQIESLVEDFASNFAGGANLVGTVADVERLLQGVLPPEQIADIMNDIMGAANQSIWDRISTVNENVLATYVAKEHPQTAALMLSKVRPACAAKVLSFIPEDKRNGIMRRMLTFKPIVDATMQVIERTVHEDFMMNFSRNAGADPHARMADIINKMDRDAMETVLASLASTRPKSAEILKGLLFTFDDIVKLTPRARTALFDQVPTDKLVLALKGTDPEFREIILQSLGARVRRMVEQEMAGSEPAPAKDVMEARRTVTDLALDMAGRGEIEISSGTEEDAYVR